MPRRTSFLQRKGMSFSIKKEVTPGRNCPDWKTPPMCDNDRCTHRMVLFYFVIKKLGNVVLHSHLRTMGATWATSDRPFHHLSSLHGKRNPNMNISHPSLTLSSTQSPSRAIESDRARDASGQAKPPGSLARFVPLHVFKNRHGHSQPRPSHS